MTEVTRVLSAIQHGDPHAADQLLPLVYEELRQLAAHKLAHEKPGQTLQATALVHEAYLRLVASGGRQPPVEGQQQGADTPHSPQFDSRGHFFAAAAEAMRRILVESARRKLRHKHGGGRQRVDLAANEPADDGKPAELLALDEALTKLAEEDAVAARIVSLRHFAGLGHEDVASTLGITVYQARQKWTYARAWLRQALDPGA